MRNSGRVVFAIALLAAVARYIAQGMRMRLNTTITLIIAALLIAHGASGQAPATHQSGKEIYDEILQREQQGRSMFDLMFKNMPVDEKKLESNFEKLVAASNELEQLAKAGDIEARYYMGMYQMHLGLTNLADARQNPGNSAASTVADRSFKEAVEWLRPLAEQNVPQAQWVYGELFANGHGVNQSNSNAVEWWFKAAQTYVKADDREDALTLFDMMRKADQSNPHVATLQKLLFPN